MGTDTSLIDLKTGQATFGWEHDPVYKQYVTFYTDQNFMSDRTNGWIKLSERDRTYAFTGIVGHWNWRLQYERDAPLDRSGLKQIYTNRR